MLDTPPQPVRSRDARRPRRRTRQRVLLGLGVVVVLLVVAGVALVGYGWYRWNQVDRQDLALAEAGFDGPKNFLVVGSDDRAVVSDTDGDASAFLGKGAPAVGDRRSDTIMIARVDPSAKTIDMLSFPRDLWVPIEPSGDPERINTAYAVGGAQNLIDTIKADFGIDIHHYVEIDFASFKGVVQAVGGVPMYLDTPMRDTSTGLYQYDLGCVTLDGDQALALARSRHLETKDDDGDWVTDPTGDIGRVARQQDFLRSVLDRAQSRFGSLDVRAINDLVSSTADNLSIDSGLELGTLVDLARAFEGFSGDQITTHSIPVIPFMTSGGASVLRLDAVNSDETLNVFRGLPEGTVSPSSVTLTVRNGTGAVNQATDVTAQMKALGYATTAPGRDETPRLTRTVVRYAPGYERHADQVARQLANGANLVLDRTLTAAGPVVLVTGSDFTTVLPEARPPDPNGPATTTTSTSVRSGGGSGSSTTSTTVNPNEVAVGEVGTRVGGDSPDGTACG
jgi:LCP family protein required for cell wall assembly